LRRERPTKWRPDSLYFGGFQKTTLVDFPGRVASIVFTGGCNMRCHYCYNPDLVLRTAKPIEEEYILSTLMERKKLIDAVVVTGGEPTIWPDLPDFLAKLKRLGFSVKLDTNGTNPQMLSAMISKGLVDYVAMDIKAPWSKYQEVVGTSVDVEKIKASVGIIKESAPDYEFRTTSAPTLTSVDLAEIAAQISPAKRWFIQQFSSGSKVLDPKILKFPSLGWAEIEKVAKSQITFTECTVRG
jgi:pyruvate formate lyase activating enzyme